MKKLLRSRKVFGRCVCCGHGGKCVVSQEIQSIPITRSKEKSELRREINEELRVVSSIG